MVSLLTIQVPCIIMVLHHYYGGIELVFVFEMNILRVFQKSCNYLGMFGTWTYLFLFSKKLMHCTIYIARMCCILLLTFGGLERLTFANRGVCIGVQPL